MSENIESPIKLRNWQKEALHKSINWLLNKNEDKQFVINAAPGSGKTIAACAITQYLFEQDEIDNVVIIAPRTEVVNQWCKDFKRTTKRHMETVTASDGSITSMGIDVCATWNATQGLQGALSEFCTSKRVLVICDEHHHAAVEAAWGRSADSAFVNAKYVLILTGTPIRSDGEKSVWLPYDNDGAINCHEDAVYTLTYGQAVDYGYCRPATFHRHEGNFKIENIDEGQDLLITSKRPVNFDKNPNLKGIEGLDRSLDFYKLACTLQYEPKNQNKPLVTGYQGTMLTAGCKKLDETRYRMPEAGGLVIAPSIKHAKYMAELIEIIEGEAPVLVHSKMQNPEKKISTFRETNKRWIVSVGMISEGVDIKRLRVLVYLPYAQTRLAFVQAIGRVVRSMGPKDDSYAYIVMPSLTLFEKYAREIESELPPAKSKKKKEITKKLCPVCRTECEISDVNCECCGHEFKEGKGSATKTCECGAVNSIRADNCYECGKSFGTTFSLSLQDALRDGAIVRGMDIEEDEAKEATEIAQPIRDKVFKSGDEKLIQLMTKLPDESFARLAHLLEKTNTNS